jgi:hypothetical protein
MSSKRISLFPLFLLITLLLLLTVGALTSVFKKNNSQMLRKQGSSLKGFCLLMEGSGFVQIITDPDLDPEGAKTYRSGTLQSGLVKIVPFCDLYFLFRMIR